MLAACLERHALDHLGPDNFLPASQPSIHIADLSDIEPSERSPGLRERLPNEPQS